MEKALSLLPRLSSRITSVTASHGFPWEKLLIYLYMKRYLLFKLKKDYTILYFAFSSFRQQSSGLASSPVSGTGPLPPSSQLRRGPCVNAERFY